MISLKLLVFTIAINSVLGWEHWWKDNTFHRFDKHFWTNFKNFDQRPRHTTEQRLLIEYFKENQKAKNELFDHNKNTRFAPKHLEGKVIIPYITHQVWLTNPEKPKIMNYTNIWQMVEKMGTEVKDGITWKHIFWTNHRDAIQLDETACGGRCEIKMISEIKGIKEIQNLVDQMIAYKFYSIDILKPFILENNGGLYLDCDFFLERSISKLHILMDSYTGSEGNHWPGLAAGIVGARPWHPIITVWKDFLLEYYGFRPGVWGAQEVMPIPAFRNDISGTSGPRVCTFAFWVGIQQFGNNDAIFKTTVLNLHPTHGSVVFQLKTGEIVDENPGNETIMVGDQEMHFERFGYQTNLGSWHVPTFTMWKLPNGTEEEQLYLMDPTDRNDILSPNKVTKDTLQQVRDKYSFNPLGQKLYFDIWFKDYFKTYKGAYQDRLPDPKTGKSIGEFTEAGLDKEELVDTIGLNVEDEETDKTHDDL